MWTYEQKSGRLLHDGVVICTGYSGAGEGKNNPDLQNVRKVGPIPRGTYTIGPAYTAPYEHKLPPVMHLIPDPETEMFGRDGFLIHGDSVSAPGTASEGCIIMPHSVRVAVSVSSDKKLEVI